MTDINLDQFIVKYSTLRRELATRDRSILEYFHGLISGGVKPKNAREMAYGHFGELGISRPIVRKIIRPYYAHLVPPGSSRKPRGGAASSDPGLVARVARLESALSRLAAALGEDEIAQAIASERG